MARQDEPGYAARAAVLVVACTLVLTASFVGVLALIDGSPDFGSRLPVYVLAMAVAFVAAVFLAERRTASGRDILVTAAGVALAVFVLIALGGEGIVYAVRYPDRVIASDLLLYFVAAGLIGTGLGYWGVRHWREFAASGSRL